METEYVEVTWGPELFSPVRYQTFTIGPLTSRSAVQPGETRQKAIGRVWNELNAAAKIIFAAQKLHHLERVADVGTLARERSQREG